MRDLWAAVLQLAFDDLCVGGALGGDALRQDAARALVHGAELLERRPPPGPDVRAAVRA